MDYSKRRTINIDNVKKYWASQGGNLAKASALYDYWEGPDALKDNVKVFAAVPSLVFLVSIPTKLLTGKATESAARGGVFEARGVLPSKDNCIVLLDASVCLLRMKMSLFASVK